MPFGYCKECELKIWRMRYKVGDAYKTELRDGREDRASFGHPLYRCPGCGKSLGGSDVETPSREQLRLLDGPTRIMVVQHSDGTEPRCPLHPDRWLFEIAEGEFRGRQGCFECLSALTSVVWAGGDRTIDPQTGRGTSACSVNQPGREALVRAWGILLEVNAARHLEQPAASGGSGASVPAGRDSVQLAAGAQGAATNGPARHTEVHPDVETFRLGQQLADLRISRGLSTREVAKRARTTKARIEALEAGMIDPSVGFLRRVVEAVGGRLHTEVRGADS